MLPCLSEFPAEPQSPSAWFGNHRPKHSGLCKTRARFFSMVIFRSQLFSKLPPRFHVFLLVSVLTDTCPTFIRLNPLILWGRSECCFSRKSETDRPLHLVRSSDALITLLKGQVLNCMGSLWFSNSWGPDWMLSTWRSGTIYFACCKLYTEKYIKLIYSLMSDQRANSCVTAAQDFAPLSW